MNRLLAILLVMPVLAACELRSDADTTSAETSICTAIMFEETPFTHCTAEPGRHAIATALAPGDGGQPYRSLGALSRDLGDEAGSVAMAMNGGMYDADGMPIGYYVEEGRRLAVLNENDGPGNFHLLPNGVFHGETAGGPWYVQDTATFAATVEDRPHFATQSGPMLVVGGELHPAIDPDGTSRKRRNAVGVDDNGQAHFLISEVPVSFGRMARYYRDVLNVDNALFLDGSVSQLWDPARGRLETGPDIGPLLIVRHKNEDPAQ